MGQLVVINKKREIIKYTNLREIKVKPVLPILKYDPYRKEYDFRGLLVDIKI